MDEDEYDDGIDLDQSTPARPIDWLIVGVDFTRHLVDATASALWNAEQLLIGHANHEVDRAVFMDEARRQIEMLTEGE